MSHNYFAEWSEKKVRDHNDRVAKAAQDRYATDPYPVYQKPAGKNPYLIGEFKEKPEAIAIPGGVTLPAGTKKVVLKFTAKMTAIGAPRMTRADAWKKRPAVLRYFAFKEQIRSFIPLQKCPDELHWKAWLPMADTWSKAKKKKFNGMPHRQKPDRDNCDKAIADSIFIEDKGIWSGSQQKFWCYEGAQRIEVELIYYVRT